MKLPTKDKFYYILAALFAIVYVVIVCLHTVNIPYYLDDNLAFLLFISDWIDSTSFTEKLSLLFAPYNGAGHRLLFTHIFTLLCYYLSGTVNLSFIIIFSLFFLFAIIFFFALWMKNSKYLALFILLSVLLLFNGQNSETSLWATTAIANVGTMLLSIIAIHLINKTNTISFISGLIIAVVAIFSAGIGLCLLPAIGLMLLLQKRKTHLIIFTIIMLSAVVVFFVGNDVVVDRISEVKISDSINVIIWNFFVFVGGIVYLPKLEILSFLFGLFVCAIYVYSFFRKYYKEKPQIFTFFTFMLCNAAVVALQRANMGFLWYRFYNIQFLILVFMFLIDNYDKLKLSVFFKVITPLVILFNIFSTLMYIDRINNKMNEKKMFSCDGLYYSSIDFGRKYTMASVIRAEELTCYNMQRFSLGQLANKVEVVEGNGGKMEKSDLIYKVDTGQIIRSDSFFVVHCYVDSAMITSRVGGSHSEKVILLKSISQKREYRIEVYSYYKATPIGADNSDFFAIIPKYEIESGEYKLGIELRQRYVIPIKSTERSVETDVTIKI